MQNDTYTPISGATLTTSEKMTRITQALADLDQQLSNLRYEVQDLDAAGICTGRVVWRNENGRPSKLYANHGKEKTIDCPKTW